MPGRNVLLVAALAVLVGMLTLACGVLDGDEQTASGNLRVYGTDDPANVTSLTLELVDVMLYETANSPGVVLAPVGGGNTVDIVAAAASGVPGLFNVFEVAPGTYRCASGTLNVVEMRVEDMNADGTDETCDSVTNIPASVSTEQLCLPGPGVTFGDGSSRDIVFDLPLLGADVDLDTGACTLQFDVRNRRLSRLVDH